MKTRTLNQHKKWAGALTLAALIGSGAGFPMAPSVAVAQPQPDNAKAVNPPNRKRGERRVRRANGMNQRMVEREMARIEQVNGKPLTEEQKTQVRAALTERVKATSRLGATSIQGLDGKFSVAGRVADGSLQLVFIAEYYVKQKPLCTQSWNVTGKRS